MYVVLSELLTMLLVVGVIVINQCEQNLVWAIFDLDNDVKLEKKHTTSKG